QKKIKTNNATITIKTNSLKLYSTTPKNLNLNLENSKLDLDIHKLNPWWVTGIVDAEGNFSINYNSQSNKITFSFKVTQINHSINILKYLKDFFNQGYVYVDNKNTSGYKFIVSDIDALISTIIPHFDKYPLKTSKQLDYLSWRKAIFLQKIEISKSNSVLYLKSQMNSKRSFEERWYYLKNTDIKINDAWLQAFIDGEGSFQCNTSNTFNKGKPYQVVNNTLEIAQNSHDVFLLEAIILYLGHGYLKPKYDITKLSECRKSRSVTRVIVNNNDAIVNFIDNNPMFTTKRLDFLDWKKIIEIKSNNQHKTKSGLDKIKEIKSNMNRGRKFNEVSLKNSLNKFNSLEIKKGYNYSSKDKQYFL
uniref:hypothetical protein n=1 Tax=Gonatophragmium mori TaxID=2966219 RepID=UPI0023D865BD